MATRMTLGSKVCVITWTSMVFLAVVLAGGMRAANSAAAADEAGKVAVDHLQAAEKPDSGGPAVAQAEATRRAIIGGWRADSLSLAAADGGRKTMAGGNGTISLVLTKDKFTLRTGNKVLTDATYTLDDTQSPCPMDVKSEDGAMLGLCALEGGRLRIALNDAAQGRPKDVYQTSNGLLLALTRYESFPLWIVNADGTNPHEFYRSSECANCGSPAWSPDGSKVVFDSTRQLFGEGFSDSRIMTVDATGGQPKEVRRQGVLPNWSPDGKKIAFCSYEAPHSGACIMNADGSDVQSIDTGGWGLVWSPKADELAYIDGANVCLYDLKTQQRRQLLGARYRSILYRFTWSPDGQWICYCGESEQGKEIAVVHRDGEEKGFRVLVSTRITPGLSGLDGFLAWEPKSGKRILASLLTTDNPQRQLYFLDPERKAPRNGLPGKIRSGHACPPPGRPTANKSSIPYILERSSSRLVKPARIPVFQTVQSAAAVTV